MTSHRWLESGNVYTTHAVEIEITNVSIKISSMETFVSFICKRGATGISGETIPIISGETIPINDFMSRFGEIIRDCTHAQW